MFKLFFIFAICCSSIVVGFETTRLSAFYDEKANSFLVIETEKTLSVDFDDNEAARIVYEQRFDTEGWDRLHVKTNGQMKDEVTMKAAGMLEGNATAYRIHLHAINTGVAGSTPSKGLQDFLNTNAKYMQDQITKAQSLRNSDPLHVYWYQVSLVLTQLEGLHAGYVESEYGQKNPLSFEDILMMNLDGDLEDLNNAVQSPLPKREDLMFQATHCSSLVKLLPDNSDIFISQDTWSSFNSMTRIFKKYEFDLGQCEDDSECDKVAATSVSFSSYPGVLFSGDDFYTTSSGLVVMETTIGNSNPELVKKIVPQSVLEWLRNIVANRLASSLPSWTETYKRYNSGTYNNMNILFDMNKFVPGQPLQNETFWISEQIPGLIRDTELSQLLDQNKYFGSYNTAYDPVIRNMSGADQSVEEYGDWFDYWKTPRALIFARNQSMVHDLESMQALMRYNNYKHDPLSTQLNTCQFRGWHNCTPSYTSENTIATRGDLNPADGVYSLSAFGQRNHVATDSKMTSYSMFDKKKLTASAISGPPNDQVDTFVWSTSPFNQTSHLGMPDRWDFPWVTIEWNE